MRKQIKVVMNLNVIFQNLILRNKTFEMFFLSIQETLKNSREDIQNRLK